MALISKDYTGWILMAVALALGIGAFFLIRQYLGGEEERLREEAQKSRGELGQVVVASGDLKAGAVIGKATMSVGQIPERHISARAVRPGDFSQMENRVLNRPMTAGEPLLADFVSGLVVNRFSELLADGTRAVSLEVSALESHSGLLIPGDYIDLFAHIPGPEGSRKKQLVTLYERVKVLAAGANPLHSADQPFEPLPEDGASYSLITIALPLDDAENLLRAKQMGEVVYLLRAASDEHLYFAESDLARFGDEQDQALRGYAYYSTTVPRGERREPTHPAGPGADQRAQADAVFADEPSEANRDAEDEAALQRLIRTPVARSPTQARPAAPSSLSAPNRRGYSE